MSELKKCPFCGKAIEKLYKNTFGEISLVGCMNLDCPFCRTLFTPKQWNTRPLEDAMQAKLDIAVEALKEISNNKNAKEMRGGFYDTGMPENKISQDGFFPIHPAFKDGLIHSARIADNTIARLEEK